MFKSLFQNTIIAFIAIGNAYSQDAVSATQFSNNSTNKILESITGTWDGQAIETPIGPVDYPITFHNCENGIVAGVAELNVSDHYWRFWESDGELRLTFMSTFRGNREPTELVVTKAEGNTINFHAPELALLTLSVTLAEQNVDIRVFHYKKPHVYIRLTRSDRPLSEIGLSKRKLKSCKVLSD